MSEPYALAGIDYGECPWCFHPFAGNSVKCPETGEYGHPECHEDCEACREADDFAPCGASKYSHDEDACYACSKSAGFVRLNERVAAIVSSCAGCRDRSDETDKHTCLRSDL